MVQTSISFAHRLPAGLAAAAALLLVSVPAATASPEPFRGHLMGGPNDHLSCRQQGSENASPPNRVRICRGGVEGYIFGRYDRRVKSWDQQPIDADVTLPAEGEGPWPLVVMLHGYPGNKTNYERENPNDNQGLNNVNLARRGYAVLNYSARGMGASCGPLLAYLGSGYDADDFALGNFNCDLLYLFSQHGNWLHLADARYEARDAQALAGYLVEDGIANPGIGVIGESYGGGQTLILSQLKDRIMLTDGTTREWTHDGTASGIPMRVAGVSALWTWSDLANALMPNGRSLDRVLDHPTTSPIGVKKDNLVDGFYAGGALSGNYPPLYCLGPAMGEPNCPDVHRWYARISSGEPYDDAEAAEIAHEVKTYHSAAGIEPPASGPAPTFMASGWTDDLFTPIEGVRLYNRTARDYPDVPMALVEADIGHERAQSKDRDRLAVIADATAWLDRYVKGDSGAPAPSGVKAWTQTCPASAPSGGPYTATSWGGLATSGIYYRSLKRRLVDASGGRADVAQAIDPNSMYDLGIGLPPDACRETTTWQEYGVATYVLPTVSYGYTMLGFPTVSASVTTEGAGGSSPQDSDGQLAARLWDVHPEGNRQTLVSKGVYRLDGNQSGAITFQLNGNGWRFERGHRPKLELLGRDDAGDGIGIGSWRASNNRDFTITIRSLKLKLPIVGRMVRAGSPIIRRPGPSPSDRP